MEQRAMARGRAGDHEAFQALVDLQGRQMWRTAWVLLGDRSLAEDAVQDAWLDVWQHLAQFDPTRELRPWLLTIVANRCRMVARRRVVPTVPMEEATLAAPLALADVAEQFAQREADGELYRACAALPTDQRRIIELRFFAELNVPEIAAILQIPQGTVKSRLHRALDALRLRLPSETPGRPTP